MTVIRFSVCYGEKLDRATLDALIQATGKPESDLVDKVLEDNLYEVNHWKELEADIDRLVTIPNFKFEARIDGKMAGSTYHFLLRYLDTINHKLDKCLHELGESRPGQQFNGRVSVHVPNMALMTIDEVRVVEDACTDRLKGDLEGGWRILAICPQPDQRRPDYILGRVKSTVEV